VTVQRSVNRVKVAFLPNPNAEGSQRAYSIDRVIPSERPCTTVSVFFRGDANPASEVVLQAAPYH
jgi:hypothetical protein